MKKYLFLPLVLVLGGCGGRDESGSDFRRTVCVSEVSGAEAGDTVMHFAGVVKEERSISLGFKTAGQISKVYVKEGQRVSEGQLLATLDDADYRLGVEALEIQRDQLSDEVSRARRLFEKKSMSANDFEKAEAGLRQLEVQLQVNRNKLAYTRLYAPTSGVIESVKYTTAEMVDAGTQVFTLLDAGEMEVVCDVPARFFQQRDRFRGFSCRPSRGEGQEESELRLLSIVPKADSNQLYRMILAFRGWVPESVTAGMNVEVTALLEPAETEPRVAAKAVFRGEDGRERVWVVEGDSTVRSRRVEVDLREPGTTLRVLSGLEPGEKVVRAGVSSLHEGDKVRVQDASAGGGEL